MRILVSGGTGFVGRQLVPHLVAVGHAVTVLTRHTPTRPALEGVGYLEADPTQPGTWQDAVAEYDALVNLAGASVGEGRWTDKRKRILRSSRLLTTRHLMEAIRRSPATTVISASAVGYYGNRGEPELSETEAPGDDFLATLCREWEAEAFSARDRGARVVVARLGVVLGPNGGALEKMIRPFRMFAGGRLGTGRQWTSWIHMDDVKGAVAHLLDRDDVDGAVNLTAPSPVTNRDFAKTLGRVLRRPAWMPVPATMLKLVMGEAASMVLGGQRALPTVLQRSGYAFRHPDLEAALRHVLSRPGPSETGEHPSGVDSG